MSSADVETAGDMQDRQPMTAHEPVRAVGQAPADLAVEVLALCLLHRDVPRERVQQRQVRVGVVGDLPDVAPHLHVAEVAALDDPRRVVGHLVGRRRWAGLVVALADGVVDVLDLGEERVEARRKAVMGGPEREVTAGTQEAMRLRIADRGIDPVPGRRGVDEVEAARLPLPLLERAAVHLDVETRERSPRMRGERLAELDADDPEAALGERPRRLAGGAADLEQPVARLEAGERDEVVEELGRVRRARRVVLLGHGVEDAAERVAAQERSASGSSRSRSAAARARGRRTRTYSARTYEPITSAAASTCATIPSTVGNSASHIPSQPGKATPSVCVGSQPASCSSWTLSPTITSSTKPSSTPVATSIRR